MASDVQVVANWRRSPVRLLMWGVAVFLLVLPAVAMQFTAEVQWGAEDFTAMAVLLAVACGAVELGARASDKRAYRAGVVLAVLTGFLLIRANLAVGVIGSPGNPANLTFFALVAAAAGGAILARGRPAGMAIAMGAVGLGQIAAHVMAFAFEFGADEPQVAQALVLVLGLSFAAMWLGSAALFRTAARES